ncbi:putative ABC transporter, permease protein [Vibrio nigripulchritudo SFn27]|uniref:Transport permease protein n=1 Tax=Vibrio nigripulchritudo TaxID=28173 RepID=A0A9P1NJL4_9VIBR|nr:ABC transporter permease [Vibrio nigripulchritudo]CBJ93126.1 Putative ABC-type multidrug transport system, permease component [Vibrio nigripulchritudo]CCN85941.1 putative ABC transporter, permease protein [Vibrio nigripulchritudo BLFn1]CCN91938.1 putative ABC transporter, permease protein [Vibrio nigripulchritudo SFn27]CCN97738.1 putative ABC transporter, permease protein [Vibrio nigripulchritudo ENn2]CCO43972.1 putative ABC transporter, permease protein [Vibrio nigripulchritudo SFn135]
MLERFNFVNVIKHEVRKSLLVNFVNKYSIISLVLWPVLAMSTIWFTYQSFDIESLGIKYIDSYNDLFIFLIIGYTGQICFWNMTQSAWQMSIERVNGTLEMIHLSPTNVFIVCLGRSIGALIQTIWVLALFSVIVTTLLHSGETEISFFSIIFSCLMLILPAICWGVFMNVIFLFTREAGFVFDICDAPMELFSGVKIPIEIFPIWAFSISAIFPLTYSLTIVRCILFDLDMYSSNIAFVILINTLLMVASLKLTKSALNYSRETGNFDKF